MTLNKKSFLNLPFEVKQISNEDPDNFIFEGYASTFGNIDLGDDIVQQGAFSASLKSNPQVPILWQHRMGEPIGMSVELREDNKGLFVKATLPKKDSMVSGRVIPQMEIGSIKEMSIGFFTNESSYNNDTDIRTLEKLTLFEISLVTKAMNPQATVNDFKSFKDTEIKNLKDIEAFLKEGGLSNKESATLISKVKEFSKQCDTEEKEQNQRDAETKVLEGIQNLTQLLKQNK